MTESRDADKAGRKNQFFLVSYDTVPSSWNSSFTLSSSSLYAKGPTSSRSGFSPFSTCFGFRTEKRKNLMVVGIEGFFHTSYAGVVGTIVILSSSIAEKRGSNPMRKNKPWSRRMNVLTKRKRLQQFPRQCSQDFPPFSPFSPISPP